MAKRLIKVGCAILLAICSGAALAWPQTPSGSTSSPTAQSSQAAEQPLAGQAAHENHEKQQPPNGPKESDPKDIVRRSVEVDHHNFERAQKYTCTQRQVVKHLDKHGNVKSTEIKTYDINFYFGEFYSRLVQIDDKPLSEKDQKKEDEKLEKFLAKRRGEDDHDRQKR
ncbi:MAG TPA: hypothetical protein VH724_02815, partial [Candidatus Angelobacter sp.]|nr:hypothetical protein [Candidatus Angelobacter sp.]